jgi:catechol 2,3-dioxygenase-like lactoylglutathione lyase family enzyme
MKLERLDHFGLEVSELARAERFYTEVLGLTVVAHFGDQVLLQCMASTHRGPAANRRPEPRGAFPAFHP